MSARGDPPSNTRRKKEQAPKPVALPTVNQTPNLVSESSFGCSTVSGDPEEGGIAYLTVYCVGMELTIHLDMQQAEEIATKLRQRIDEEKELQA